MQSEKVACQNTENIKLIMVSSFYGSQNWNIYTTSELDLRTAPCYLYEWSQLSD